MTTQDEITKRLIKRNEEMTHLLKLQNADIDLIMKKTIDFDKVPVKTGAEMLRCSQAYLYKLIGLGKIKTFPKAGKMYVSVKELQDLKE